MKLEQIIKKIEESYPKKLAMDWDNVGLLAGSADKEISTVLVTLDITPDVVAEAIGRKAELILSHHPLIFDGIKNFTEDNFKTKMYADIIRSGISVYSAHTNMDCAENGINQRLAELLELKNINVLVPETGLGRYGEIDGTTLLEYCEKIKGALSTPFLKVSGNPNRIIKRVAVGSGASAEVLGDAIEKGCDLLITGDVKYHIAIEAVQSGIAIIDAGHYPTEIFAMDMFEQLLQDTGLNVKKSQNKDIFSCV